MGAVERHNVGRRALRGGKGTEGQRCSASLEGTLPSHHAAVLHPQACTLTPAPCAVNVIYRVGVSGGRGVCEFFWVWSSRSRRAVSAF